MYEEERNSLYTRGITMKRFTAATSDGALLRTALNFEEASQRWQCVGDSESDSIGRGRELQGFPHQ